jgi:DNA-binding transcriptional ArsR family regulator
MPAETRRDAFQAIADPTRRQIIHMIANRPMNLKAIAEQFDMSRPAVSQHIKILMECGVVEIRQLGRERFCEAKLNQLSEVSQWIDQYKQFFENKLDNLETYLERLKKKNAKSRK